MPGSLPSASHSDMDSPAVIGIRNRRARAAPSTQGMRPFSRSERLSTEGTAVGIRSARTASAVTSPDSDAARANAGSLSSAGTAIADCSQLAEGVAERPSSRAVSASSKRPPPWPPRSSSNPTPAQPSATNSRSKMEISPASNQPRTAAGPARSANHSRSEVVNSSCSSESSHRISVSPATSVPAISTAGLKNGILGQTINHEGHVMEAADATTTPSRSDISLSPFGVPKASDVLANELRERILTGDIAVGTSLPAERDLVIQTRMSRATVREALRILEVQNLVRVKAGRAGGAFVQRPTTKSMANSVSILIRGRRIKLVDLMETREALEPFCAELAARNRTDEDLAELDRANKAIADPEADLQQFLQANLEWHVGVAVASHNELLIGFMSALSEAIYAGTENPAFVDTKVRAVASRAHRAITTAIRDRDAAAAGRRMRRHVHSYAAAVAESDERDAIDVGDAAVGE